MPRDDVVVPLNRDGRHQPPSQPPTDSGRPVIVLEDGQLHESANQGEQALIDAGANVYQRGGGLVAIADKGPDDRIQREPLAPRLVMVSAVHLRELLTRHATWLRYDGRRQDYRAVDCPMSVAATLCERGQWRFPELIGLIHAPTLREDGSLLFQPGYDRASGLYLVLEGRHDR